MKKLLVAAMMIVNLSFGVDFSGMNNLAVVSTVKDGDMSSLVEAGFELKKRASIGGVSDGDIGDACSAFHNIMQRNMSGKSPEEIRAFKNEFHMKTYQKLATLSKDEQDKFDMRACSKFAKKTFRQGCNQGCNMAKNQKCGMSGKCMSQKGQTMSCKASPNCPLNSDISSKKCGSLMSDKTNQGLNKNCPFVKNGVNNSVN